MRGFMTRAFRRPVPEEVLNRYTQYVNRELDTGMDFTAAMKEAASAVLASPRFLYLYDQSTASEQIKPLDSYDLASRLSFFLWSGGPDEELLSLAENGRLRESGILKSQVTRMMDDPKAEAFIKNFIGQWLYLRNLDNVYPLPSAFPEFDDNLRESFKRETELFFDEQIREDHSLLDLFTANYSFLNERLADHYGVQGIYGNHFRKVSLDGHKRGGLLGHGSLMTVTSYPNRTSVVLRGKFVLDNLLGSPPPEPPPNVPALEESSQTGKQLTMREAMAQHRENPACRVCHAAMDPIGFSLENYDAIGKWRDMFAGVDVDASGLLPDGAVFNGRKGCLLYTSPSPRDRTRSRMPSSA